MAVVHLYSDVCHAHDVMVPSLSLPDPRRRTRGPADLAAVSRAERGGAMLQEAMGVATSMGD